MTSRIRGVLAPVLTPFNEQLKPDAGRFLAHCRWLIDNQVSLAIFGTNSEAVSLSVDERMALTDHILAAGIPAARLMPGTGACSITDAVRLTRHAVDNGASGALMLPPFFYKGVTDEGLFAYYSEVIEQVGSARLKVYLYHIPQVTQVPITLNLIEMLRKRYPDTVVGAKDSSGVWDNTKAMLDNFAKDGFDVFPASESTLSRALPLGAAGCISATVNMNPAAIAAVYQGWNTPQGPMLQAQVDVIRQIFQAVPMIAAMKRVVAEFSGDARWKTVRPPLVALNDETAAAVLSALGDAHFAMPGYPLAAR
ncbi:4-hydroxy-tetrahydrodipicolinate synthase [mine drainage metagenome]|uniref:4-hydroxy-tetrahydrodipicolinate synthase n=1 Tax=mine drainage metagenome TaxID=410659 RepID=A0A1J5PXN2_9ZZZZ